MNRKSYSETIFDRYINEKKENSKIIDYKDEKYLNSEIHFYDDLDKEEVKGFPIASDFVNNKGEVIDYDSYKELKDYEKKEYRLRYHYLPLMHEMYIGTTGSGKTTTCIEPQLRAISSQKNKPNIFVSDPKGEIFLHNVKHLKDKGYKVQVLNFKDIAHSNCWNPLEELYLKQMELKKPITDFKLIKSDEFDKKLTPITSKSEFHHGYHLVYQGLAFPTYKSFKEYIDGRRYIIKSQVSSLVNQLCSQMFPPLPNVNDPTWSDGAREFFKGIMLALLDDAINPDKNFTKEMFNVKTINDVYTLVQKYDGDNPKYNKKYRDFMANKPKEAVDKITLVSETAPATKKGFLSTCQSLIGRWMNGHIFSLTCKTNIDLDDKDNPIALFIITRDYDKSDNVVAGLFLNWVYRHFLEKAEKKERVDGISASRPMHFMLDEFANIPEIPDFEVKIATSRSRNMWFHLYIQSYEQLDAVYKDDVARIIVDNCNQQIFLGSQSVQTKERFSRECGNDTIRTIRSLLSPSALNEVETLPVLPLSKLNNIKAGSLYIKRLKCDVIKSQYIRSYELANEGLFSDYYNTSFEQYAPLNLSNPDNKKYIYPEVVLDEFINANKTDALTSKPINTRFGLMGDDDYDDF